MRHYVPLWSEKWDKIYAEEGAKGRKAYDDSLTAQKALESLERRFEALTALLTPQAVENENVAAMLQGAKDDIAAQRQVNSALLQRIPVEYRTPRSSHLADQVFATPELLELILTFVSVPDLLRLYRVNKTFYNTIEGSTTLQRRLGLQPNVSCHLDLPAEHLIYHVDGMDMSEMSYYGAVFDNEAQLEPNKVPIKISVNTYSSYLNSGKKLDLRPIGERCKKMLLVQPPIKEMGIYAHCCTPRYRAYRDRQPEPPLEVVKSETGITLEQVWDAVMRTQKEHRLCPDASAHDHDNDGFVQVRMSLESAMELSEDDPALVAKARGRREGMEEDEEIQARERKFAPYIAAKRSG